MASPSTTHKGWHFDRANARLQAVYNGTEVLDFDADDMVITPNLTVTGTIGTGAATLASATTTGNHTFSLTITAGADGVGADGEQLTSGGAAAECDWAAAGSLRQFKKILGMRTDEQEVLEMLAETPVYDFQYLTKAEYNGELDHPITTGDTATVYTGIMADEAPFLMHHKGRILNPINTVGYLLLGIKALTERVQILEAQVAKA